jgi:ABC-type phosphate transport system substrate-binding protein
MKLRMLIVMISAAVVCAFAASAFAADMVVIVNNNNTNAVDRGMIQKIYKGELTSWPAGGVIKPYDLSESSDAKKDFVRSLLGMSPSTLKAMWSVKLFSGKATPPKTVGSDEEMKREVSANRNAIGYISASSLDSSVKSVLTLP